MSVPFCGGHLKAVGAALVGVTCERHTYRCVNYHDKHILLLSPAVHLRQESIQTFDVKIVTKSEKRTGCFTLPPLRPLRNSDIPGVVGRAAASASPEVSKAGAGND